MRQYFRVPLLGTWLAFFNCEHIVALLRAFWRTVCGAFYARYVERLHTRVVTPHTDGAPRRALQAPRAHTAAVPQPASLTP